MELRHLRYFCTVADSNSFTEAAQKLHISQSSVSEQVRDLEDEIGVPLFDRGGRQLALTPHGVLFLEEARKTLTQAERAVQIAQRSLRGETGTLSIGFMVSATSGFFSQIIRDYRHRYPGVHLSLFEMSPVRQMEAISRGDIDIGFTRSLESRFDGSLRSECLFSDALIAVLPKSHPLARGSVAIEQLASERFVLYDRDSWPALFDTIIGICRKGGFSPQVTDTALIQTVLTLVEAGEGVTLVPSSVRRYRPKRLAFCRLKPEGPRLSVVMAWRAGPETTVQKAFLDLVRENKRRIQQTMGRGSGTLL